jgi:hypothetical protein
MNYMSINIRGVKVKGKAKWINNILKENGIQFLSMQETLSMKGDGFN